MHADDDEQHFNQRWPKKYIKCGDCNKIFFIKNIKHIETAYQLY